MSIAFDIRRIVSFINRLLSSYLQNFITNLRKAKKRIVNSRVSNVNTSTEICMFASNVCKIYVKQILKCSQPIESM